MSTLTHHHTTAGLITRTKCPDGYTEWALAGEEISVDTAADLLAHPAPESSTTGTVFQILADHIHDATTYGGLDWDDLIEDLRRAGHKLPEPTEETQ